MATKGSEGGAVHVAMRFDTDTVKWLDNIARGAATDRGVVCAVLLSIFVDKHMGEQGSRVSKVLAGAAEGHVIRAPEPAPVTRAAPPPAAGKLDAWVTIADAAAALGLNQSTVWRHVSEGTVKSRKEGNRTMLSMASLRAAGIKPRAKRAGVTAAKKATKATKRKRR